MKKRGPRPHYYYAIGTRRCYRFTNQYVLETYVAPDGWSGKVETVDYNPETGQKLIKPELWAFEQRMDGKFL